MPSSDAQGIRTPAPSASHFNGPPVFSTTPGSPADELAKQIEEHVERSLSPSMGSPTKRGSVAEFERLAVNASWKEVWPGAGGKEVTRTVTTKIWNAPIQAALAKHGSVFLPKRDKPYYINNPIVLKSEQRLYAAPAAEIRLVPGTNTCMVRNEHVINGQDRPIPDDANPDTQILVEGGIWTTLATGPEQSNANEQGWPARKETAIHCHGVILLSNVRRVAVRNLVIRQSRAHAVQLSNCREFLVEGVTFEEHRRDGIHVNGPASHGIIRKIRGATADDVIALNAWDWSNTVPTFGPIARVLVEDVHGNPKLGGTDEIRLLPGTKTFADGHKLDCPVADCVFRNLRDIRTIKMYDQPNGELGRDKDYSDPIGTIKNVFFHKLVFTRPGLFQVADNVDGLAVDDVQLNFNTASPNFAAFKLVEIGPMSQTAKSNSGDPSTWVELFSPDRDVTVRNFRLADVRMMTANGMRPLPDAESRLVKISDQKPNPDYPKTTPRGGKGRAIVIR
jgi:hypothetical protein